MKLLKKFLHFFISPYFLGLIVTLLICYMTLGFYSKYQESSKKPDTKWLELLAQIHEKTVDWRMKDRGPRPGHDRVAILAVDDKAVELEGRWPWPREKTERVVERVIGDGAKVIAFDIVFAEEDTNSSLPTLRRIERQMGEQQTLSSDVRQMFELEKVKASSDAYFGKVVEKLADHLVLGTYFDAIELNKSPGFVDACLSANFSRTSSYQYWNNQMIATTLVNADAVHLPRPMREHLLSYFDRIEQSAIYQWLQQNQSTQNRILKNLTKLQILEVKPEVLPVLMQPWLLGNNKMLGAALGIEDRNTAKEIAEKIFFELDESTEVKDQATLRNALAGLVFDYCADRFFRGNDELRSEANYQKRYNSGDYADWAWEKVWPQVLEEDAASKRPLFTSMSSDAGIESMQERSLLNPVQMLFKWWINIPVIAGPTKHSGYFNASPDSDGNIRRSPLVARFGDEYSPSIALKSFLLDSGFAMQAKLEQDPVPGTGYSIVSEFAMLDSNSDNFDKVMTIPVDRRARLTINYSGSSHMFPHISAADILSDKPTATIKKREFNPATRLWEVRDIEVNKKDFLKDKILFFGATAIGIYDLRVTPFEENFPGVETHANVLSNLLVERDRKLGRPVAADALGFLHTVHQESTYMLIAMLVLGLSLTALISYFGSVIGLLITITTMVAVYVVDKYYFFQNGVVIAILFPALMVASLFVVLTFYKYFTEERKKRELKGTFEKYVSPAIVNEVLKDPENISLGGKKMELTVMFSDVRGFTTISEKLDPQALSDLLNSYLTPMTELVFANKGTLDKYMGDAIMAFWGAPIHFADHAKHACRCALQSLEKLKELQAQYRAQGLPEIDIGIGLNSGEMSVGNMGSNTVRSYTVMGDSVNLGSRLEGINKQYGTRIIISEFTQKAVGDSFVVREIDWVKVKGKKLPVRIFELMSEGAPSAEQKSLLEPWNTGFQQYHNKEFEAAIQSFTQALNISPNDEASKMYVERCQDLLREPPPADWDGVFTMTTK